MKILLVLISLLLFCFFGCMIVAAKCEQLIGYSKDICYTKEALRIRDQMLCGMVEERTTRELCYARLAALPDILDISICERIATKSTKEVCYCDVCKQVRRTEKWAIFGCAQKCPEIKWE